LAKEEIGKVRGKIRMSRQGQFVEAVWGKSPKGDHLRHREREVTSFRSAREQSEKHDTTWGA